MVSPKDKRSHVDPLQMYVITHLHERLVYIKMFMLNNAIGLGVIQRDLDVMDAIFLRQVPSCSHKCGATIGNNFSYSTPLAKDILKDKVPKSLLVLLLKGAPLGPRRQGAMGLDNVPELINGGH